VTRLWETGGAKKRGRSRSRGWPRRMHRSA